MEEILKGNISSIKCEKIKIKYENGDRVNHIEERFLLTIVEGRPTTKSWSEKNGKSTDEVSMKTYDENNLLFREIKQWDGEDKVTSSFYYNNENKLIHVEMYINWADKVSHERYRYENQNEVLVEKYKSDGELNSLTYQEYENSILQREIIDDMEKLVTIVYNHDGNKTIRTESEYNNVEIYDKNGLLLEFSNNEGIISSFSYEFDEQGNWTKKIEKKYGLFEKEITTREITYY